MADRKTLQAEMISAHPGPSPGHGMQRDLEVCKLVDTTTCIGCKACEVACVEWNDMPFSPTTFDNTYQTMPETRWNFWNLIKFNEHQNPDGTIQWLMRKDQCMHCADPGCLAACPADGAIVKYANGIVDFNQENCIGCEFCVSGCPFDIPRFNPMTKKVYKCTLCSDRVGAGPGTRMHQGVSHWLPEVRHKGRHEVHRRGARQTTAREVRLAERRRLRSAIRRWHACDLRTARRHRSRALRRPAEKSQIPWSYTVWKWLFKPVLGTFALFGFLGVWLHYVTSGPRRSATGTCREKEERQWLARVERFDDKAREKFESWASTTVYRGELLRHPVYTRVLHWTVALFFFLALFSGFGIYLPWLFRWFTPIFGGGPLSRTMHPWFGVGFVFFFGLQALNWLGPMTLDPGRHEVDARHEEDRQRRRKNGSSRDRLLQRRAESSVLGDRRRLHRVPDHRHDDVGGRRTFGGIPVAISYVLHDISALIMLGGIFIHIYQSTFGEPGTFQAMIRGAVSEAWAWTFHPAWYKQITGRDPQQACEEARRKMNERR